MQCTSILLRNFRFLTEFDWPLEQNLRSLSLQCLRQGWGQNLPTAALTLSDCSHDQRAWLNEAIDESQKLDVNVEMFVTSGDFFDQVLQFIRSQPIIQFVVLDESNLAGGDAYKFSRGLRRLRKEFEGEILLVRRAGDVTHFSDLYGSARGIRV